MLLDESLDVLPLDESLDVVLLEVLPLEVLPPVLDVLPLDVLPPVLDVLPLDVPPLDESLEVLPLDVLPLDVLPPVLEEPAPELELLVEPPPLEVLLGVTVMAGTGHIEAVGAHCVITPFASAQDTSCSWHKPSPCIVYPKLHPLATCHSQLTTTP